MSQPAAVCHNKVQAELKAEIESLSQQRVFCHDMMKNNVKKIVTTLLTMSRQ